MREFLQTIPRERSSAEIGSNSQLDISLSMFRRPFPISQHSRVSALKAVLVFGLILAMQLPTTSIAQQASQPHVICLMVKDNVYGPLEGRLQRWKADKESLGASIILKVVLQESASEIRLFLKNITGLTGSLMVGDIPYVEYEWTFHDVYGKPIYDRFPSDLYYMDLNGEWVDSDGNGAYDKINGDLGPEIWVGRLKTSNLSGDQIELLERYFDKNHNYLSGTLTMPQRALLYIDETTPEGTDEVTQYYTGALALKTLEGLSRIYPEVVMVRSLEQTNSSDYLARLKEPWSLVRLNVHGDATGHGFLYAGKKDRRVTSQDIKNTDPRSLFYVITSCHNFDYRKRDYIAAWYVFGSYGLFAIGDSSIRDILVVLPEVFYWNLKQECFGIAYLKYARECVTQNRNALNVINYVMVGDPSLGVIPSQPIPEFSTTMPVAMALIVALILLRKHKSDPE